MRGRRRRRCERRRQQASRQSDSPIIGRLLHCKANDTSSEIADSSNSRALSHVLRCRPAVNMIPPLESLSNISFADEPSERRYDPSVSTKKLACYFTVIASLQRI